jgi:DNA-binding transcriptional LysR family regulator
LISPIIGLFLKHNDNLNIRLQYGNYQKTLEAMKDNQIDVAILPDLKSEFDIELDEFEERFLMKDEMWLVGSGRDTALPNKIKIDRLNQKPVVVFSEMYPGFRRLLEKRAVEANTEFMPVFETDNVGTLKRVIESGLGWGFLPSHSIKKQVRARRLSYIQTEGLDYSVNINFYVRKTEKSRRMADVFFRAIQQQAISN